MILDQETKAQRVLHALSSAKAAAKEYRALTGRPLGITGEIAEYEAARLLALTLAPAREAGYDAIEEVGSIKVRYQIKSRCIHDSTKRSLRVGAIKLDHGWDVALLVLLDADYEATAIYEAKRDDLEKFITTSTSRANKRGAIGVNKLKSLGKMRWPTDQRGAV
jgi:hypothetical protein